MCLPVRSFLEVLIGSLLELKLEDVLKVFDTLKNHGIFFFFFSFVMIFDKILMSSIHPGFFIYETVSHCLELTKTCLPLCPPNTVIKGMCHHPWPYSVYFMKIIPKFSFSYRYILMCVFY